MSRPPAARDAVLDAFERLLIADGERSATIEATAREAGVSKGGLLYHFPSKDALIAGLLARLDDLVAADVDDIESAPEGPIAFFVRSSIAVETPLDRTFVSVARLAQGGHNEAASTLKAIRLLWLEVISRHVADPSVALAICLIGDGLYYDSALDSSEDSYGKETARGAALDALVALLERLATVEPVTP